MAFIKGDLNTMGAGALNGKIHHYVSTTDNIATIEGSNYFNPEKDRLATGDVIFYVGTNGAKIATVTNTAGVITLPLKVALA